MRPLLLLAPCSDDTARLLAPAAQRRGIEVRPLHGWRAPWLRASDYRPFIHAMPLYVDAIAFPLRLGALQPADGWLAALPRDAVGRDIRLLTVAEARAIEEPVFVQPPLDRTFAAGVYPSGALLPGPEAVADEAPALVSSLVSFGDEFRFYLLDGEMRTGCRYRAGGALAPEPLDSVPARVRGRVLGFLRDLLEEQAETLPSAVVLDLGLLGGRPAVIHARPAWTGGHHACDIDGVLDVALRASGHRLAYPARDEPYLRPARMVWW